MATSSSTAKAEIPHSQPGPKEFASDDEGEPDGVTPTSPTASISDLDGASVPPTLTGGESASSGPSPSPVKEFSFFFTRLGRRVLIVLGAHSAKDADPEQAATYYVKMGLSKYDVTLAKKSSDEIVGVGRIRFGFGTHTIGLGDPDAASTAWESLKRHGAFRSLRWEFSLPVGDHGQRRTFNWKRTHDKAIGASASLRHKKLVDVESGQVVAVYLGNGWRKEGKVLVFKDYGYQWEVMMLMSLLGLIEEARRR